MARLKKTITVTILPGVTEKSRQWTFPTWAVYLFLSGLVALFAGIVLLVFFYSYETKKFMALQTIQEETRIQQQHLDNYRKKLDAIEAQLSEVNNLDAQIMNMVAKGAPDVHRKREEAWERERATPNLAHSFQWTETPQRERESSVLMMEDEHPGPPWPPCS